MEPITLYVCRHDPNTHTGKALAPGKCKICDRDFEPIMMVEAPPDRFVNLPTGARANLLRAAAESVERRPPENRFGFLLANFIGFEAVIRFIVKADGAASEDLKNFVESELDFATAHAKPEVES